VQESWLDGPNLDATPGEPLDTLVEERTGQRARTIRDRDDHAIEVGGLRVADRADSIHGVGTVLADGEDMHPRSFEHLRAPRSPQALP
jgi:hypothetical protein